MGCYAPPWVCTVGPQEAHSEISQDAVCGLNRVRGPAQNEVPDRREGSAEPLKCRARLTSLLARPPAPFSQSGWIWEAPRV